MLLIQSILIYTLFGLSMFALAKKSQVAVINNKGQVTYKQNGFVYCIILFTIMSAIRWGVGVDYFSYLRTFNYISLGFVDPQESSEWLYSFIRRFLAVNGFHYTFYFGILAFLQILFIALAFKNQPDVFSYVALLCILGGYYLDWMNGIRQCIAMCSFVWATKFIQQRKIVPYLIWLFLAAGIHRSILLVLPLFLFSYSKRDWTNRTLQCIILAFCVVIGGLPVVASSLNKLIPIIELLGYDNYVNKFEVFQSAVRDMAWGPIKISRLLVQVMIIVLYPQTTKHFRAPILKFYYKFFFMGTCMYYILCNTSYLFLRPIMYLTIFGLPMTAYTLMFMSKNRNKYKFLYWFVLIAAVTTMYWACIKGYRTPETSATLYEFFFSPNKRIPI